MVAMVLWLVIGGTWLLDGECAHHGIRQEAMYGVVDRKGEYTVIGSLIEADLVGVLCNIMMWCHLHLPLIRR